MLKLLKYGMLGFLFLLLVIFGADYWVKSNALEKNFTSTLSISKNKVGLLLGTGKFNRNGYINAYYKYRIDAAIKLYKAGKIEFFLISGDNSRKDYDEPSLMKEDLVKQGVPENKIFLDYAGFRTLDSMVRANKIFGQSDITVISQKFHNERAIFLGESFGLNVIGFNARDVSVKYGLKTQIREKLARVKMLLDIVFGVNPKFLGQEIEIK